MLPSKMMPTHIAVTIYPPSPPHSPSPHIPILSLTLLFPWHASLYIICEILKYTKNCPHSFWVSKMLTLKYKFSIFNVPNFLFSFPIFEFHWPSKNLTCFRIFLSLSILLLFTSMPIKETKIGMSLNASSENHSLQHSVWIMYTQLYTIHF